MYPINYGIRFDKKSVTVCCTVILFLFCQTISYATTIQSPKMKELEIKKIRVSNVKAADIPALLDGATVSFQPINSVNWKAYPYCPEVKFRMAYTDSAILLHYKVEEGSVRALADMDNGPVWKDACVEFFSIPAGDGVYYNIECNCAGFVLIGAGNKRNGREHAPIEVTEKILRWSSLGRSPFEERVGDCSWELALVIPYSAFFKHHITSLEGKTIKANFYKCGDELRTPHYLSWNPIDLENPNFHCPEYFGNVHFVKGVE